MTKILKSKISVKTSLLWTPRFLVPSSRKRDRRTDRNINSMFVPSILFLVSMDPLIRRRYILLLLELGERSLEGHTRLFLVLANLTTYPDDVLCAFYSASLNIACGAVIQGWTSSKFHRICGVDTHWREPLSTQCPAQHADRRDRTRRDQQSIAAQSDWAEVRCGTRDANDVSQGAWAGNNACLEGECHGRCERGEELQPPALLLRVSWAWRVACGATKRVGRLLYLLPVSVL